MNIKKLYKQLTFVNNLLNVFNNYALKLDKYFEIEENKINHKELYNYYQKLIEDIKKISKGVC